jgi:hypothetical protein
MKETGAPEVLTIIGRAELVVQDVEGYQAMLEKVERAELLDSLRDALRLADAGEGSLDEIRAELRAKHGF